MTEGMRGAREGSCMWPAGELGEVAQKARNRSEVVSPTLRCRSLIGEANDSAL